MKNIILSFILLPILLTSCTNYFIPIESFKDQFKNIDSTQLVKVNVLGPYGERYEYDANPIKFINCIDKNKISYKLKNSPSIEIRFTQNNGKKTIFYFDRVIVQDTMIFGMRSRFIGLRKGIPLNNIKLIEVQDGKKNFTYEKEKIK